MVQLNITIDEARKAFIDKQIALGRFADANAFFDEAVALVEQHLIEEESALPVSEEVEQRLMEAINDPTPPVPWTRDLMDEIKRQVIENHAKRTAR